MADQRPLMLQEYSDTLPLEMRTVVQDAGSGEATPKYYLETNVEIPTPEKYDIVIQVKSCALSRNNEKVLSEVFKKNPRDKYNVGYDVSGTVVNAGSSVTNVRLGDTVVGVVPLDMKCSGCGEYCVMSEFDVVRKPDNVSFEEAAAAVGDCVRAYTAVYYQARVCGGDTVLIIDGATPFGSIALQLASQWGAKVITTASSQEERVYLENLQTPIAQVIDLSQRSNILVSSVMEETGGVGVDVVVDNGARLFTSEEDINIMEEKYKYPVPHKHDVISCLGVSGKWITCQYDLQLDPPDSQRLFLRGSSVSFLFDQTWTLSCSQQGRYQHILQDAMNKLENGTIKCKIAKQVKLDNAIEALKELEDIRIGRVVVNM